MTGIGLLFIHFTILNSLARRFQALYYLVDSSALAMVRLSLTSTYRVGGSSGLHRLKTGRGAKAGVFASFILERI